MKTNRTTQHATSVVMPLLIATTLMMSISSFGQNKSASKNGYANVNGLKMYYEVSGTGKPLVLLHGSFMTIGTNYGQLIPEFSKTRKVIAMEFQGHGHTADIDRPFSFEALADDVAGVLKQLKVDSADVLGYSLGGSVAMQVAIRHPQLVKKLVIISAVSKSGGWSPETSAVFPQLAPEWFEGTPIKIDYDKIAPNPKNWATLISKIKALIVKPYDFSNDAAGIKSPTLFIFGDSDGVRPEHMAEMMSMRGAFVNGDLGKSSPAKLAVLPGTSHTGLMMRSDLLLTLISPFLGGK